MKAIDAVTMECCGEAVEPRAVAVNYGDGLELHVVWRCKACKSLEAADSDAILATDDAINYDDKLSIKRVLESALRDSQRPDTEGR